MEDKKKVVDDIQREIDASKETHIWSDYVNALKLISQVVFTRSSGFILEMIQNAEDAGLGQKSQGVLEIKINKDRVKIIHNGRPFSDNDGRAICGIRSSKKPENGTLGYLGIGFKSVFKVTDCPEIYSNGFRFKFDRNHWSDPSNTPWHVIPIWIDKPSEAIDAEKTTFIIPFREKMYYSHVLEELKKVKTELYLFLRWLKKIEVSDEVSGKAWTMENIGENKDGITVLKQDGQEQRLKFFRHEIDVPDWVKQDRLTQEYRANVTKREIAIAFALDKEGNLAPSPAGAMYGGVSSFLPLGEERSGAKFPIQADFLVQPGREAINYEAKWNHWLVEEVVGLCKEAIEYFKKHYMWKYQFLLSFEFTKSKGLESYEKLFGPKLIEPLEKFLDEDDCIPTVDNNEHTNIYFISSSGDYIPNSDHGWAKPKQVVRLTEYPKAIESMITIGFLKKNDIAPILGGQPGLKLVHPNVKESSSMPIRKIDRFSLFYNEAFLEKMRQKPDASNWFMKLYLWLAKNSVNYKSGRNWYVKGYHDVKFILTSEGKLLTGGKVSLPDLPPSDPILKSLADTLQSSKPILHPDILAGAKDEEEQKILRKFLTGLTGVQILDNKTVCKEVLLPKILTTVAKPSADELLKYTIYCQQILGEEIGKGLEFWIIIKKGGIRPAKEVLFSTEFKPEQNWETHQQYVSGINFISPEYLAGISTDDQLKDWRQFFKAGGMKDSPDNGVEEFAMNYSEEKLEPRCKTIVRVDKRNFGYDIEAETKKGIKMHIEVKGQSSEKDVELTDNETEAADKHKDTFYLCVVSNIPENPALHMVQNPAAPGVGKKDKLTVPVSIWKSARWL